MNRIKNLEALEALRSQLPDRRMSKGKRKSGPQGQQEQPQAPLDAAEAEAYGQAFDALLTLWQALGTLPSGMLPTHVRRAQTAATMRLRPLLADAVKAAS